MNSRDRRIAAKGAGAQQAVLVWAVFMLVAILINGTIPFALGADLHGWTTSATKGILFALAIYGGMFLVVPLVLVKGWKTVRQPGFLLPLSIAVLSLTFWELLRGIGVVAIASIAFIHWRYDLSDLGIRWSGTRDNMIAVLLFGAVAATPALLQATHASFDATSGLRAGLDRLLANPASSVEYLFYFGFLAERLSGKTGRWATPLLIGAMYMAHEMTNPEYWYQAIKFYLVFIGVAFAAALYLWRRSILPVWLGDGLGRFLSGAIR